MIDLERETTVFVGANNSGKTSATHVLQRFFGASRGNFTVFDFTADCWEWFNQAGQAGVAEKFPAISLDLWFEVDSANIHRVKGLIPSLEWRDVPVGVRIEYRAKDVQATIDNYRKARTVVDPPVAEASISAPGPKTSEEQYRPWPVNMTAYLERRLRSEFEIVYSILDHNEIVSGGYFPDDYVPEPFPGVGPGGQSVLDSIIRIDFMDAQRHLSDGDSRGRAEELSKRLASFYRRNLKQFETDVEALKALAASESQLNAHYASVFRETLGQINTLGYPGFANPEIAVKATMRPESMLTDSAGVHYVLPGLKPDGDGWTLALPDQYNGLGFKNLIYMALEVLDHHKSWCETKVDRPPVHLVLIEEPEAHLHAQLQQVFVNKILEVLPNPDSCQTQLVITTHSAHIIYESSFKPVRYFRRFDRGDGVHVSEVRDLSRFYDGEEEPSRSFLYQYFKITHCDLFFADAAVLVEGNVERLLLPLMIEKEAPQLRSSHLTILEVGGAFAHKFERLLEFIGLPALVITDLDSVRAVEANVVGATDAEDQNVEEDLESELLESSETESPAAPPESDPKMPPLRRKLKACLADEEGAETSNQTLRQWIPKLASVEDLLRAKPEDLLAEDGQLIRVAYQMVTDFSWGGQVHKAPSRTFEESFALTNLEWTQESKQRGLQLRVLRRGEDSVDQQVVRQRLFRRVRSLDKTQLALELIASSEQWATPAYIKDGLQWLALVLTPQAGPTLALPADPEVHRREIDVRDPDRVTRGE